MKNVSLSTQTNIIFFTIWKGFRVSILDSAGQKHVLESMTVKKDLEIMINNDLKQFQRAST